MTALLIILLVLAFVSGAPLFSILLGASVLGASQMTRGFDAQFIGNLSGAFGDSTGERASTFATIPLFIYAGYIMAASKTADRLIRFANALMGWVPGGLAVVTIGTSAIFTTFTGASGVTIVALGGVIMPALLKQGYPKRFSLGLIAGTGSVGLLFPPALPLFVFGAIYGLQDVSKKWDWDTGRFLYAGIVPGLVLVTSLSAVAIFVAVRRKLPTQKFNLGELGKSFIAAIPEVMMPILVIGLLASGKVGGVPQVAVVTVVYIIVVEMFIYRDIKLKVLWDVSGESLALTGTIFLVIFASSAFTSFMVNAQVPTMLVTWTNAHIHSPYLFLLMLNVLLLLVGMTMDIFSAIVIVVPLIAPTASSYGIEPYHLGVMFLLNLEIGYLHPPVGLNLYIASFKFRVPVAEVMVAVLPFMGAMFFSLALVTYIPKLTVVPEGQRTATLAAMRQIVHEKADAARSVAEVPLVQDDGKPVMGPDGKQIIKKKSECDALASANDKQSCNDMFVNVTECRNNPPKDQTALKCEQAVVSTWVSVNMDIGGSDDDDDDDDAGKGSGSGKTKPAKTAPGAGSGSGSGSAAPAPTPTPAPAAPATP